MSVKKPRAVPVDFNVASEDEEESALNRARVAREAADEEDTKTEAEDEDYFAEPTTPVVVPKVKKPGSGKEKPPAPVPVAAAKRTVRLDHRQLPKNVQKKLDTTWKGRNRGKAVDHFFKSQAEQARKVLGHSSVFVGGSTESLIIGIPCPSLAMEYLIAQDCFPLGLVIQLVAKHGVGKSALVAEFGRWFHEAAGGMNLIENETKFNPHWYSSILTPEVYNTMPLYRSKSLEDWQRMLTFAVTNAKRGMIGTATEPGPGRTIPIMFAVDSIMGKQSEEIQEKILGSEGKDGKRGKTGTGHAGRAHPVEALKITQYMKTVAAEFDEWPFSLVLVNHLKMKTDDMGNSERSIAGGAQVGFQESFELELQKVGGHKRKIQCADFEGVPLAITCEKNSFGPTHRKIQTRLLWWFEEDETAPNGWVQKTSWDWDWSTVHLLNSLTNGENAIPMFKKNLKDIEFHIECPSIGDVDNRAWSRTLGMKEKDATRWSEVGAMIRADATLMQSLRKALRINHRPLLEGDYLRQMESLTDTLP